MVKAGSKTVGAFAFKGRFTDFAPQNLTSLVWLAKGGDVLHAHYVIKSLDANVTHESATKVLVGNTGQPMLKNKISWLYSSRLEVWHLP